MKAIRTYQIDPDDNFLRMDSVIPPVDEDSLELPWKLFITAFISPDSIDPSAFAMQCDPEVPLDIRISEMQHFLNLLKFMYYGS